MQQKNNIHNTQPKFVFQLFVDSHSIASKKAILNFNKLLETNLNGKYQLQIIDVYQHPALAIAENVLLVPLLIKKYPLPEVKIFGELSDTKKILSELLIEI